VARSPHCHPVHVPLGSRALAVEGFEWDGRVLKAYAAADSEDGAEGRMVMVFEGSRSWDIWKRHPGGDEILICLSARMTVIQEVDGGHEPIELDRAKR
jgi:hypothetical protein